MARSFKHVDTNRSLHPRPLLPRQSGAWPLPELDQARQSSVIDPTTADIIAARSEAARSDVPGAVARLRHHTNTSAGAVEILVEVLEDDGQYEMALQECARGIERFGESVLDARHLNLLLRTERRDAAADWAIQLLSRPDVPSDRRLALRQGLTRRIHDGLV